MTVYCYSMPLFVTAVLGAFIELAMGETCMRVLRKNGSNYNDNNHHPHHRQDSWQWFNFECRTGCCGETFNQQCCPEKDSVKENKGLITALSVGMFCVIILIIIITICCACHRSRQKRSQRMRRRRHISASTTLSTCSSPPSYETSMAMSPGTTGGVYPAEIHSPPSYEEAISGSTPESHRTGTAYTPTGPSPEEHARLQGRDNAAFSVADESNRTSVSVIS